MSKKPEDAVRRASAELVAVITLGVTILLAVLGQAAWLDGKIERIDAKLSEQIDGVDVRLTAQIENLQIGQSAIRERLAALEVGQAAIRERLAVVEARPGNADTLTTSSKP
ncbi:MAG: hypothetical protein OXI11_13430 [Gammaproteobacteria bacterium]|nr:hypothetical protein [Gammaproteobacteria bacterium]MXW44461.1 hypothetical protein [Gammaproteobacteria bacterium]MYD01909.1 hypothetical protein [Gammaproteobacteria bacterium]MYI24145.1 hypothetical protein [Gammaproteobacteria bacterium]